MNINVFWEMIEAMNKQKMLNNEKTRAQLLGESLQQLEEAEFIEFYRIFRLNLDRAYISELWAAEYIINCGCSDDCFLDFRAWLISEGQLIFEKALVNPETLIDVARDQNTQDEEFSYVCEAAYYDKFGRDIPLIDSPPAVLKGVKWEEEKDSLRKMLPLLFKTFWEKSCEKYSDHVL